ncbi:hypothetical protein G4H71_15245 [Rhodococcus triatomae]|uniref:Uncharacterized protein n=1 Tax=Rhodococcus triatomae TaxID=300028 RepID=A0A1G8RQ84_9NOCA|nr:hypothetical protein [Rhodococcus triatomae]QNG19878.1 hypothetical protein G4H72_15125 [Rhodococcus triatomae]QNG24206.1 hypothetical protein G4H71_15245 [Rhodococcus triatomae]SDJ19161.1 hypothetical protein SAMN05444695_11871 [Rhodococcus triatomae]
MGDDIFVPIVVVAVTIGMITTPFLVLRAIAHLESEDSARARFARHFGRDEWVHVTAARVRLPAEEMGRIALQHGYVYAANRLSGLPLRRMTFARIVETPGVTQLPSRDEEAFYHQIFQSGKDRIRIEPDWLNRHTQPSDPPVARICTIAAQYGLVFSGARNRAMRAVDLIFTPMDSSPDLPLPNTYLGEIQQHWNDRRKSRITRRAAKS